LNLTQTLKTFGGDRAVYSRLLHKFLAKQSVCMTQALQRFDHGDARGAAELIHDLSGMAGLLQLSTLSLLAAHAESALLTPQTVLLPALFEPLQAAIAALAVALERFDASVT
jgi:HPt (histidine-containing phosphotransfer) domain-containing protein